MTDMTPLGSAAGIIVALAFAAATVLVFVRTDVVNEQRRPRLFAAVFICVAALNLVERLIYEAPPAAEGPLAGFWGAAGSALLSLGTAGVAFLGGNGFELVPDAVDLALWHDSALAWIAANPAPFALHLLFEIGNILALALTAEFALTLLTRFRTRLAIRQDAFGDVIIVAATEAMRAYSRAFIESARGARRQGPQPALFCTVIGETAVDSGSCRVAVGEHADELELPVAARTLGQAVAHVARTPRTADGASRRLSLVTLRNGHVSVSTLSARTLVNASVPSFEHILSTGTPDAEFRTQGGLSSVLDSYTYGIEEVRVRQLMRRLLSPALERTPLGKRPLVALITGEDLERVIQLVIYLARNGQALSHVRATGEADAAYPRILVASTRARSIETYLRQTFPALFPAQDGHPAGCPYLTPPAEISFFTSKFEMVNAADPAPDDLVLVAQTDPDTGRSPQLRESWHQRLTRLHPSIRPIYVQFDTDERPTTIFEDAYGGRDARASDGAKPVILYGSLADTMRADVLLHNELDRRAMLVNYRYCRNDAQDEPQVDLFETGEGMASEERARYERAWNLACDYWASTDAYGRNSSRASADFAIVERDLWRAGAGELAGADAAGRGADADLEPLHRAIGQLEHLRWNAYMITCGFTFRPWDTIAEKVPAAVARAERALERDAGLDQARDQGPDAVQALRMRHLKREIKGIWADTARKRHAALVDWDALPAADHAIAAVRFDARCRAVLDAAGAPGAEGVPRDAMPQDPVARVRGTFFDVAYQKADMRVVEDIIAFTPSKKTPAHRDQ